MNSQPLRSGVRRKDGEGGYEHLATKADLANLKADLIKWWGGMIVGGMVAAASMAVAISSLLDG